MVFSPLNRKRIHFPQVHFPQIHFQTISLFMSLIVLMAGGCSKKSAEDPYLVRAGNGSISGIQFQQAVEAAVEEAFPGEHDIAEAALTDLRMRVFNQLTEELLISERARELGIQVPEAEVEEAVAAIKADYPDNTFEETLLENAVSFANWKQKLVRRLLVEKVVQQELVDQVQITSQDVAAYYKSHYPEGPPENEDATEFNQKVVRHLRQQKAEQAYKKWIESLRQKFPVDVNREQWRRLEGESLKY